MPNRVIRESMLDSTRYLSVNDGARLLYMQILLLADDFGCLSVEYPFIGRRCFDIRPSNEQLDALVGQLVEADLIRLYKYRDQRFAFIPRFRQRLKRETLKNPQPPDELLVDDLEAQEKFRKLNGHQYKGAVLGTAVSPPPVRPEAARSPTEEAKESITESKTKDDIPKERVGSGYGSGIESEGTLNPAPASVHRSPVDLAAELEKKMRLR